MAAARDYLSLIKFAHTVFALPFALMALLVTTGGAPPLRLIVLVLVAMVCARSAAMAYNRWADRDVDALNPRTAGREIPRGVISPRAALWLTVASAAGFAAVAYLLSPLCFVLSIPVLAVLLGYSHAKRFTSLSHAWLGLALGLAPVAAALAATGRIDAGLAGPAVLGLGVAAWVAGFDVLYACQDDEFDRVHGLHSLPARLGRARAMQLSRAAHALAVVAFTAFGFIADLGAFYGAGVAAAAALLALEHRLLRPDDLRRMQTSFFTLNGLVGLALLSCTAIDLYW
jgi:4-hydroxybenzoate polyprenyltransferase